MRSLIRDEWACPSCGARPTVETELAPTVASFSRTFKLAKKTHTERWQEHTCCGQVGDATKAELKQKAPEACCPEGLLRYCGRVVVCG